LKTLASGLVSGHVDFGERGLDLHAVAKSAADAAAPGKEVPDFRFDIGGSWTIWRLRGRARPYPPVRRGGAAVSAKAHAGKPVVPSGTLDSKFNLCGLVRIRLTGIT